MSLRVDSRGEGEECSRRCDGESGEWKGVSTVHPELGLEISIRQGTVSLPQMRGKLVRNIRDIGRSVMLSARSALL